MFSGENMNDIRLIGIDLDGTSLNREKKITHENRRAFMKCRERGIEVVPVTGRPVSGLYREYIDHIGCSYSIHSNGAAAYSLPEGERIISHTLSCEKSLELADILAQFDCFYAVFVDGFGYLRGEALDRELDVWKGTPLFEYLLRTRRVTDDPRRLIESSSGCDNIYVNAATTEIREEIRSAISDVEGIYFTSSDERDVEIGTSCSKGTTLLELAKKLGINKSEVMAVGDSGNDVDMLRRAGFAVAMENATAPVLSAADFVTRSCEDSGVAYVIDKLLNGELL